MTGLIDYDEMELWILNDAYLYELFEDSGQSEEEFIEENEDLIREHIEGATR